MTLILHLRSDQHELAKSIPLRELTFRPTTEWACTHFQDAKSKEPTKLPHRKHCRPTAPMIPTTMRDASSPTATQLLTVKHLGKQVEVFSLRSLRKQGYRKLLFRCCWWSSSQCGIGSGSINVRMSPRVSLTVETP